MALSEGVILVLIGEVVRKTGLGVAIFGAVICLASVGTAALAADNQPASGGEAALTNGVGSQFEMTFWQSVQSSNDPTMFEAYLAQYPNGTFHLLAKAKVAALARAAAPQVSATPVVAAVPAAPLLAAPLPVAPLAASPLPAPLAVTAPAALPVAAPVAAVVPATPAARPSILNDAAALGMLARSQMTGVPDATAATRPQLPARPQLEQVTELVLPEYFCSADERNAFHAEHYVPALAVASRNNRMATAYMASLQQSYDGFKRDQDTISMNAVAADAQAYHPIAASTAAAENAFAGVFTQLMAVSIKTCEATAK